MTEYSPTWFRAQYDKACSRLADFEKKKPNKIKGAHGDKTKLASIERRHARLKKCVELYAEECGIV
jgi:hypothetical protein